MGIAIVVIDDDQDDLDMMDYVLKKTNPHIRYIPFQYPREAVKQLCSDEFPIPDYIFIDLNMPLMSGCECLLQLRNVVKFEDVKIVMFSTHISEQDFDRLRKGGAASIFKKPYDVSGYVEMLKDLL